VVADNEAGVGLFGCPWRREAALGHHLPVHSRATSKISKALGMTSANTNAKNGEMLIITDT